MKRAKWGYPGLRVGGLSLWSRASNGDLHLASYTPPTSHCWSWYLALTRRSIAKGLMSFDKRRTGQWHDYIRLPFCWLIIGRQDYHKDPRHQNEVVR